MPDDLSRGGESPSLGHNSGIAHLIAPEVIADQLAMQFASRLTRRDDLLNAVDAFSLAYPNGPLTDDDAGLAGDQIKQIKDEIKEIDALRVGEKKPFDAAAAQVQAFFKGGIMDKLEGGGAVIQKSVKTYLVRKDAEERRAREEAARRAREEAAEKERIAREALAREEAERRAAAQLARERAALAAARDEPPPAPEPEPVQSPAMTLLDDAIVADQIASDAAKSAAAKSADLTRTRGAYGSVTSLKTVKKWEVTDFAAVPDQYKVIDKGMVDAAMKSGRPVDGIRYYEDKELASR